MNSVTDVLDAAQGHIAKDAEPNRFLDVLEQGRMPRERLRWLAGELHHLVGSDRRSFALLASRFPDPPAGSLYLAMAEGEGEALGLLGDFAAALGMAEPDLRAYEPRPLAQAYPAYLVRSALYGSVSDVALALLANVQESGDTYARVADALVAHYGFEERAVGHFRYFADTPQPLLDQATAALADGLSRGDDPGAAVRCARTVHGLENAFWNCLARGLDPD
ncbi:transcriptional regulator [Streptomyces sp. NPDC050287]|uniref:transcriptional regulator n=1 Tax=Streptomyces sp. NPDC050287 TaxID=3365608 RepID=UPI0037AE9B5E